MSRVRVSYYLYMRIFITYKRLKLKLKNILYYTILNLTKIQINLNFY